MSLLANRSLGGMGADSTFHGYAVSQKKLTPFGSLMHSAVNIRMGNKEDRPLL